MPRGRRDFACSMRCIIDTGRVITRPGSTSLLSRSPRSYTRVLNTGAELGYEVMLVRDATADYSVEHMRAALDINLPNYATAIVTASEAVERIGSLQTA